MTFYKQANIKVLSANMCIVFSVRIFNYLLISLYFPSIVKIRSRLTDTAGLALGDDADRQLLGVVRDLVVTALRGSQLTVILEDFDPRVFPVFRRTSGSKKVPVTGPRSPVAKVSIFMIERLLMLHLLIHAVRGFLVSGQTAAVGASSENVITAHERDHLKPVEVR
jgi:hypothetical protein